MFRYVPTHKSHLDYHMLSYALFSEGLACPHIAAGALQSSHGRPKPALYFQSSV